MQIHQMHTAKSHLNVFDLFSTLKNEAGM